MREEWLYRYGEWILPVVLVGAFGALLLRQHFNNNAPTCTAHATVDAHRLEPARYHGKWSSGWNHLVSFRLSDGDTVELYTTQMEYAALKDGLRGTLVWQNENMLRFLPEE